MNKTLTLASLALILFNSTAQSETVLSPFSSDGCSAFPDGTLLQQQLWLRCCEAHDLAYWKGGTYQQRKQADQELKICVSAIGEPAIGALMLAGVRVGGSPYFPTTFRWGYGWPYPRAYGELSEEERQKVQSLWPDSHPKEDTLNTPTEASESHFKPLE